jgi:hypothetical protein
VDWINVTQDKDKWWAFVKTEVKIWVSWEAEELLPYQGVSTISISHTKTNKNVT